MISILTPVHPTSRTWLHETYQSLFEQTNPDWEWILLPNSGLTCHLELPKDPRIRIIQGPLESIGVGALKKLTASYARGDILLELDADDLLTTNALASLARAFKDPDIGFVYSNSAAFYDLDNSAVEAYSSEFGWRHRDFRFREHVLHEMIAWEPSAAMMRSIWWAPDHLRAWRASTYANLGGHDETLIIGDDHDLCCRTYIALGERGIKHIDECLYVYRIHGLNTHLVQNAEVQAQSTRNYLRYSRDMAIRWAMDLGLDMLDLGGRFGQKWGDFTTVDLIDAGIITDLNEPWPFPNNSIGVIKAHHIFEHLKDPIHTMNEAFRVLAPGGWLFIEVPSTDGRGAWQDPTHVSFWNENSFRYYTTEQWGQYIRPSWQGKFQNARTVTYDPFGDPTVPVVQSDLIAVKGSYAERPVGEVR